MYDVNIYILTDINGIKKTNGQWGAVAECIDRQGKTVTREEYGSSECTTKNQMTLQALYIMLSKLRAGCNVTVCMDNQWVINMISGKDKPYKKWKLNGWRTARNESVANKKEWEKLETILDKYNITFTHKTNHSYKSYLEHELKVRKEKEEKCKQESLL